MDDNCVKDNDEGGGETQKREDSVELKASRSRGFLPEARRGACCFLLGMSAARDPARSSSLAAPVIRAGPGNPRKVWYSLLSPGLGALSQGSRMGRNVICGRGAGGWQFYTESNFFKNRKADGE